MDHAASFGVLSEQAIARCALCLVASPRSTRVLRASAASRIALAGLARAGSILRFSILYLGTSPDFCSHDDCFQSPCIKLFRHSPGPRFPSV